jgi:excisionase family DNA binding protein
MTPEKYMTIDEVGDRFHITRWTVRRWIDDNKLPVVRVGRRLLIPAAAVEELERQNATPGETEPIYTITREPAPLYHSLDRMEQVISETLALGGWPAAFSLRREGLQKALQGEELVPTFIWQYLVSGIVRLRSDQSPVPPVDPNEIVQGIAYLAALEKK